MGLPVRVKEYSISDVFTALDAVEPGSRKRVTLKNGLTFRHTSERLVLFRTKGTTCVACHLEASHFVLEAAEEGITPHLNLYATVGDEEILFTKDHIFPKSKGGADEMENYQTMCFPCNWDKGARVEMFPRS